MYRWYRIKTTAQTGHCDQCGAPLDIGDQALEGNLGLYCSEACREDNESCHHGGWVEIPHGRDSDYPG